MTEVPGASDPPDARLTIDPAVVLVEVGATTVAYVPERRELLELTVEAVAVIDAVSSGDPSHLPPTTALAVADHLLAVGVLHERRDPTTLD